MECGNLFAFVGGPPQETSQTAVYSFATAPNWLTTTQMFAPSNATPPSWPPTPIVFRIVPSLARILITTPKVDTHILAPSNAIPTGLENPSANVPWLAPSLARSLVTFALPLLT